MSFSTCTQYWYPCPQNSLFPQLSHQEFWMSCGDDLGRTSEIAWRETGLLFYSGFLGGEKCCPGRRSCAESQLHLSAPLHSIYRWQRAGQREQWGSSNFAWHTNPSQMVMLKITRNSNVELHRPSEKIDDLKQFLPRSKGIFKCGRIVILKTFLTGLLSAHLERGFPQWLFQMEILFTQNPPDYL